MSASASSSRGRDVTLVAAGAFTGAAALAIAFLEHRRRGRQRFATYPKENPKETACVDPSELLELPPFARALASNKHLHRVRLREWEDTAWRAANGWRGRDLCHNPDGRAVRVLEYYYDDRVHSNCVDGPGDAATASGGHQLVGVVHFGPDAESHRGLCHGGAMSSLMDDFAGHAAFVTSDSPWSGATVQVNVSLKKPVKVGSILRIAGRVRERKGRKVYVEAVLDDGGGDGMIEDGEKKEPIVYATLEGLSIDGVKMSEDDDEISSRTWEVSKCEEGRLHRRDSGWKMP